jgi:glycosyltransferase involved in cell wall biosynthesis
LVSDEQLDKEMFKAHILVLPSWREGHPLILFEAWAHRLPVIATNVGSVAQFVSPKNGYLVPAGAVNALAQAMTEAINNQNLSKLGESGYELVKNYTWDKTASAYANSLESL